MKLKNGRKTIFKTLTTLALAALAVGCGKENADIELSSAAVPFTGPSALMAFDSSGALAGIGGSTSSAIDATSFSFCVKRVRLEGEDDQPIRKEGETGEDGSHDADDINFTPGLITVSDNQAVQWGTMNVPVGFKLKRLKIKLQKSPQNCSGANYSVSFNGVESNEDIEFRWKFEPALDLTQNTGAIGVSLASVVSALRTAGTLDASHLKNAIESVEGAAFKK